MADDLEKLAKSGVRLQKAIAMGPEGLAETLSGKSRKAPAKKAAKQKPEPKTKTKRGKSSY